MFSQDFSQNTILNCYVAPGMFIVFFCSKCKYHSEFVTVTLKNVTLKKIIVFGGKKEKADKIIGQRGKRSASTDSSQLKQAQLCTSALKKIFC